MPFDAQAFDTMYDLKTKSHVISKMRQMIADRQQLKKDYKTMHRMLREQGVKIPTDLPEIIPDQNPIEDFLGLEHDIEELLECFCELRSISLENLAETKAFVSQIFMGSGHPKDPTQDNTAQNMAVVYFKVKEAFSIISGMQQNGGMGYEFNEKTDEEYCLKLKMLVADISRALLPS